MITIGKHSEDMSVEEVKAIFAHANTTYPNAVGVVDIYLDGEYVDLTYSIKERAAVPFQRIRRITGYLVGGLGRWNNAKLHELSDREKHLEV